jgi:hypothetical protein
MSRCSLCGSRFETRECPRCTPIRRRHNGQPLAEVLPLLSGLPLGRSLWSLWSLESPAPERLASTMADTRGGGR